MRILLVSNMFPPFIMGGAEMAAHSLAVWLSENGHEVHVLTSAPTVADAGIEKLRKNYAIERRVFPSLFQIYQAPPRSTAVKTLWHAHDHFHLFSEKIVAETIQHFQPDLVNTHNLQGIGYNLLRAIGRSGVPCVQTIHDFGLVCVNMNRFKNGHECETHHLPCQFSASLKKSYFGAIRRLSYWSPSVALLRAYEPFLASGARARAIPLPLIFAEGKGGRKEGPQGTIRLLYVGQIVPWKGVAFVLGVLRGLAEAFSFSVEIVGGGSSLAELEREYTGCGWVHFSGKLPPEKVSDAMQSADVLLVPSLWFENAPLVISQAIQLGLPVLASDVGGLPELVGDRVSGRLVAMGDAAEWATALREVFAEPGILETWQRGAEERKAHFTVDSLGARVLTLFQETMDAENSSPATDSP